MKLSNQTEQNMTETNLRWLLYMRDQLDDLLGSFISVYSQIPQVKIPEMARLKSGSAYIGIMPTFAKRLTLEGAGQAG